MPGIPLAETLSIHHARADDEKAPPGGVVHLLTDDGGAGSATGAMMEARGLTVMGHAAVDGLFEAFAADGTAWVLVDYPRSADGLACLARMGERRITGRAILMIDRGDVRSAVSAIKLGAVDVIERPCDFDALAHLLAGRVAPGGGAELAAQAHALVAKLSPREAEVLALLHAGKQNKAIAFALGLSTRTVEMHRASLMHKLGARSLSDALRIAFQAASLNASATIS